MLASPRVHVITLHDHIALYIRMDRLLNIYFPGFANDGHLPRPSNVCTFRRLLVQSGSFIMGSFPLFCLEPHWRTWSLPGDMDIFLRPASFSLTMCRIRRFKVLFSSCGYVCMNNVAVLPYIAAFPSPIVITFLGPRELKIQIIFFPHIPLTPQWHLSVLLSFDLSCCSVAYDGDEFSTTHDNLNPTIQPVTVRHWHNATHFRVQKYVQRGFVF